MSDALAARLPRGRNGQILAVGLVLAVGLLTWWVAAVPLLDWHAERTDALERRTTLARRMAQIAADLPRLRQAAAAGPGQLPDRIAVMEGGSDAVAGAALQQRIQDMATAAGTPLSSTEVVPAQQLGGYRQIGIQITLTAPWPNLVGLMQTIAGASPQMLIDDVQVHGGRNLVRDGSAPLNASLTVFAFRAGAAAP